MKNASLSLPHKILFIGDNLDRAQAKQWLEDHAEVVQISDIDFINPMVQEHTWDLVITDIKLSGLNVSDVLKTVKLKNSWTSFLVISNHQTVEKLAPLLQSHEYIDSVLFDPIDQPTFVETTLNLLKKTANNRKKEQKVILAIGAHPDDVEIGCGGSLLHHHSEGAAIHILTLSRGECGGKKDVRKKEAQLAAEILQANLVLGNFVDTQIPDGAKTIHFIEEVIQQVKPTHVYTHSRHDNHQDHRNTHLASVVASRRIPNFYCYQSPSATIHFKPNLFLNISNFIEQKLNALACYQSQIRSHPYISNEMIRATAVYWGRFTDDYHLAEPMEVLHQNHI